MSDAPPQDPPLPMGIVMIDPGSVGNTLAGDITVGIAVKSEKLCE